MRFQFDFNTISKLLGGASNEAGRFDRGRKGGSVGFGTGSVWMGFYEKLAGDRQTHVSSAGFGNPVGAIEPDLFQREISH